MLRNTLGIVNIEGKNVDFGTSLTHKSPQAYSFLARYHLIDFVLSNMSNSGITESRPIVAQRFNMLVQEPSIISIANEANCAC